MSVTQQLYELQAVDLELGSQEQALRRLEGQLGESGAVTKLRSRLDAENQRLEELRRNQHSLEWEIDDIANKITRGEEELYSGRIKNPKELASLQQDMEMLKGRRGEFEDGVLAIMEQTEAATASIGTLGGELKTQETEWRSRQQELTAELAQLKTLLTGLRQKREALTAGIDPETVGFYDELRQQKGTAVVGVEQGICRGCRISLSSAELQRARSGNLMQCSSCGRILFLA